MSCLERRLFNVEEEKFEETREQEQETTRDETDPIIYLTEIIGQLAISQKALVETLEKQKRKPQQFRVFKDEDEEEDKEEGKGEGSGKKGKSKVKVFPTMSVPKISVRIP